MDRLLRRNHVDSSSQLTYTAMTLAAHIVGGHGDIHALTLDERRALVLADPEVSEPVIMGTKWFCVGVATYITFIWLLKFNMLFLYQRIVNGLWVEKFIIPTMGLVVVTYISIMMLLFLPCRPYHRMWIIFPDQGGMPPLSPSGLIGTDTPQTTANPNPSSTWCPPSS